MSKFKPGDLALVICGDHAGETVELVASAPSGVPAAWPDEPKAVLVPRESSWWVVFPNDGDGEVYCWAERHLMPLRGDFDFAKEREQEVVHG